MSLLALSDTSNNICLTLHNCVSLYSLLSWQLVQTAEKTGVLKETSLPQVTDNFIIKLYPVHLLTMGIYETQRSSGSWHSYVNADPNITLQRAACECIFVTFDNL